MQVNNSLSSCLPSARHTHTTLAVCSLHLHDGHPHIPPLPLLPSLAQA